MRGWTVDLCYRETLTSFSFFYLIYIYHHLPMNHIQCHSHSAYNHHCSPSTLSCHHSRLTDSHHCSSLTFSHHCLCLTQATIIHPLPLIHDHHPWISSSSFLPSFAQNYFNNIVTKLVGLIVVAVFFVDDVYNNGG